MFLVDWGLLLWPSTQQQQQESGIILIQQLRPDYRFVIESSAGGALLWLALTDKLLNVVACANLSIVSIELLCYGTLYYIIMFLLVDGRKGIGIDWS